MKTQAQARALQENIASRGRGSVTAPFDSTAFRLIMGNSRNGLPQSEGTSFPHWGQRPHGEDHRKAIPSSSSLRRVISGPSP